MTEFAKNASGVLLHYIRDQRVKVERIARGEVYAKDDPRFDLCLRHEADKLDMLQSLARDAGHDGHGFLEVFSK